MPPKVLSVATALLCFTASVLYAQNFKVPERYTFESVEAYHRYDADIINCAKWLETTAPGDESGSVKRAKYFLMEWQTGCPYVKFQPNARIDAFLSESPEFKIFYVAGWVRYSLENNASNDRLMCTYAGIKSVLKVYRQNKDRKRDANLEDLLALDAQSKLRMWVQEKLK